MSSHVPQIQRSMVARIATLRTTGITAMKRVSRSMERATMLKMQWMDATCQTVFITKLLQEALIRRMRSAL